MKIEPEGGQAAPYIPDARIHDELHNKNKTLEYDWIVSYFQVIRHGSGPTTH
jgi:hypothetical protein